MATKLVMCKHCGLPTPAHDMATWDPITAQVWAAMVRLTILSNGGPVNATDIGKLAQCHRTTATRHLIRLQRLYHLVEPVRKVTYGHGAYVAWQMSDKAKRQYWGDGAKLHVS